jgi:hypothetical protein
MCDSPDYAGRTLEECGQEKLFCSSQGISSNKNKIAIHTRMIWVSLNES